MSGDSSSERKPRRTKKLCDDETDFSQRTNIKSLRYSDVMQTGRSKERDSTFFKTFSLSFGFAR